MMFKRFLFTLFLVQTALLSASDEPSFYRGLNLNGPSVIIDGNTWDGLSAEWYLCNDQSFESQIVNLNPPTDLDRAKMIRSSRYGGNRIEIKDLPKGTFTFFLYVWEDNNSETFSIFLNDRKVVDGYRSGKAGHWERLGPWVIQIQSGEKVVLTSKGGAANFSGIEIWQGDYDGLGNVISQDHLAFFEKKIRPLLVNKCYECHSAQSDEAQGDLLVDSRATIRRGGISGPAIIPGDPQHSLLMEAVRYENENTKMPPNERLSDEEIKSLQDWIQMGAPDPRANATKHLGKQIDVESARQFWSLKPIVAQPIPNVIQTDWPRLPIDFFVLDKLEKHHLTPSVDADREVLIRRVTFDLIGLPPTLEEIDAFFLDRSPDAFEKVVDRLLQSPRYGERWGRHWLDIVRYADTAGDNSDYPIPQIHRYRDWVIEAFNRDLPYDEFVRDQIAGDLRGGIDEAQRHQRIIATGYLANARRFGSRVDDYPEHLTIEDSIDNLGRTFLGLTLSCARCHDHKFDPVTNRDYYALYGIFHSTRYPWPGIELDQRQRDFIPLVALGDLQKTSDAIEAKKKKQDHFDDEVKRLIEISKKSSEESKKQAETDLKEAQKAAEAFRQQPLPFETAYAVTEASTTEDVAIQIKGDPTKRGDLVPRRFLTVLGGKELPTNFKGSGRKELADWIVDDNSPLTSRVIVNRIWQYHFGRGLVSTPNDFGRQGKPPTHPELLDFLATTFREQNGSIKSLHRMILLSRTYQQSSTRSPHSTTVDPSNEWLSAFPRRRLDAEAIRDTLLTLGGAIDLSCAGPHPFPPQHTWSFTQHAPFKAIYETNHRSVYLMTQRIQRHPFLAIFDGADPSTSTANRMTSTTPLQALFFLNSPFFHETSAKLADRVLESSHDDTLRIDFAYRTIFSRGPTPEEVANTKHFLNSFERNSLRSSSIALEGSHREAWLACVRSLLRLNEFVYVD